MIIYDIMIFSIISEDTETARNMEIKAELFVEFHSQLDNEKLIHAALSAAAQKQGLLKGEMAPSIACTACHRLAN